MPDVNVIVITDKPDKYELEVVECVGCGGHLGIDASFLRHASVEMKCPYCGRVLFIEEEIVDGYRLWIKDRYSTPEIAYGKCAEATEEMQMAFPELRRVRGHYYCAVWGEREHWWLETTAGVVVDPTAIQFPSKGHGVYVEFDEEVHEEPTGMCPNCGEYCYNGQTCCCDACHSSYAAYVMNPN